jgi:hypothetical protein
MTAFNIVRFRVKPGREQEFVDYHRSIDARLLPGARRFSLVKTGNRTFCALGEWEGFQNIVAARATMIGFLDAMRDCLEELGSELGVTDPISGEAVVDLKGPALGKPRTARKAAPKKKAAAKRAKAAPKKKAAAKKPARKPAKKPAKKAARRR